MLYECPKCGRFGMEWDGRAKVLICCFNSCNHVIRIPNQKAIPTHEQIVRVIRQELPTVPTNGLLGTG